MRPRAIPRGSPLVADPTRWEWAEGAACAGHPWELFYGHDTETGADRDEREATAKQVCEGCPLNTWKACLERALIPGPKDQHGVQGGHTPEERIQIRHNRQRHNAKQRRAA
ncbi:WhiB family transcriptional regulator [Nocardiopsis sp. NRRL B-16309]|uniref:WhiB family transcriptional regulator n=1 Tax=Nocardiopsis sp. NRRL B-16309 TaxID=1519494 RepID=UPI0006AFA7F7|nr:WhiB family transcriptional regulator [Nocardiopsis sp. NRRL B-16309]KOX10185.1 hypothetical protein ADL05_26290 [Nocardiopsis sp. NRRL B-16309]